MSNPSPSLPFLCYPPNSSLTTNSGAETDLRHLLLRTSAELDSTRLAAHEELRRMETQAFQLTQLLDSTTRERDQLRLHCHSLLLLLSNPNSDVNHSTLSASEEDEGSNGTSPNTVPVPVVPTLPVMELKLDVGNLEEEAVRKGLPEKGRLVEAVVAAGPLLNTLLLAGPLPRWRHPPPAVRSFDIPVFSAGKEVREEAESSPESNSGLVKSNNGVGQAQGQFHF
ncbi:hypothetical protein LUZ60_016238 [Juncus effusus]|nr:hypothetical protein LUZ60_016238 [Juncus effusus]